MTTQDAKQVILKGSRGRWKYKKDLMLTANELAGTVGDVRALVGKLDLMTDRWR